LIILPVVLYGCKTWSLTLREEHRLRVFENRVLRRIFGGSCIAREFIICTHPQISLGRSSQGEWVGQVIWHAWERREKCTRFRWVSPKERDHLEDQDGIRMDLSEIGWRCRLDWTVSG
jgi:hypothetical protein